jgi:hypothetical protein
MCVAQCHHPPSMDEVFNKFKEFKALIDNLSERKIKILKSALDDKTPHEVWTEKKPALQHLRVFGCDAYVHVPKENRSKLDKKVEKCIFIGYKDGVKDYKLWNPDIKKIVYSRDVVFIEVKMFPNRNSYQGHKNMRK